MGQAEKTREDIRVFKYALDPTPRQERLFRQHVGAARFAYNHGLSQIKNTLEVRAKEEAAGVPKTEMTPHAPWSHYGMRKAFNEAKNDVAPWWGDVSKEAFNSGFANLAQALKNWKIGRGFPRFKNKHKSRQSVTFTTGTIRIELGAKHITLPRLGRIHLHEKATHPHRLTTHHNARITQATLSHARGRWHISLLVRTPARTTAHPHPGTVVGVDVGVKDWLVAADSEGREVARVPFPERVRDLEARRRTLQRRARHKRAPRPGVGPSNRWVCAQRRIAALDHRIANIRDDILHKETTRLCREYETVVVETLSVKGMSTRGGAYKTGLNRAIAQSALARTRTLVGYKTSREGGTMIAVDRFYPSSKTCSECGAVKSKLALSERTFACQNCGVVVDRDANAATNLARLGAAGSGPVDGRGAEQKTSDLSGLLAAGNEASTSFPLGV